MKPTPRAPTQREDAAGAGDRLILLDDLVARPAIGAGADAAEAGADGATPRSAREEVEAWLGAVALCFGLPEGRRWIEP